MKFKSLGVLSWSLMFAVLLLGSLAAPAKEASAEVTVHFYDVYNYGYGYSDLIGSASGDSDPLWVWVFNSSNTFMGGYEAWGGYIYVDLYAYSPGVYEFYVEDSDGSVGPFAFSVGY